jgi:alpha-glucosidase
MRSVEHDTGDLDVRLDFSAPSSALCVMRAGEEVIEPSPIGIGTPDGRFPMDHEFVGSETRIVEEEFRTPHGKRREHHHRATLATYTFESESGCAVDFEVCVALDGIAYRYRIDGDGAFLLHNDGEESGFRFPDGAVSWLFSYDVDHESVGKHHSAQLVEGEFTSPGLFRTDNSWILAAEAGVDGTYGASHLTTSNGDGLYEFQTPKTQINFALPGETPWRVAMIGDLSTVAESSLVRQLVEDVQLDDTDWIKPGRVAWSWWGDTDSPTEFGTQKEYVEYAAERGWEYVLVDAGWDAEWVSLLVEYADERGVDVLLWTHWTALHRADDRERRLDQWDSWGIAGIKIDFMDNDDQGRHQFYDQIMEATAERELMVNFHGSVVPTGLSKRWSHVMTYEGVKGAEHYQWTGLPPEHNTILPFTRNVIGSMDYTPVTFSADNRYTSDSHELALSVVFESGLQHFADGIEQYAERPEAEWFLERVPAAWDETILLGGYPGSEATLARRCESEWFIGSITAGPARTVSVSLPFLDDTHEGHVIREDTDTGESLIREQRQLTPDGTLDIDVSENGGFCVYCRS